MKLNITQQTTVWHEFREGGIGSSDVAAIMGKSPYKSAHKLWLEKTKQIDQEDLSQNYLVQRGVRLEPEARQMACIELDASFEPACFVHDKYDFMRFSADGFDEAKNMLIEIKVPHENTHNKALRDEIPEHYMLQIQYGLLVSGAEIAHFVSYNPSSPMQLATIRVEPDLSLHDQMIIAVSEFWDCVLNKRPLACTTIQNELYDDIQKYQELKDKIKELESEKEALEAYLKDSMRSERSLVRDYVMGYSDRKGAINYSDIEVLKGVDLELYRKKPTKIFQIKKVK